MDDEDEILAAELGEVGAAGGRIGAAAAGLFGVPGHAAAGARGAARGAARAARRLRKDVHEIEVTVGVPPEEARGLVTDLIQSTGRLVGQVDSAGTVIVRGVVGAGAMNLNPAVLTITLSPKGTGSTTVLVRGAAKEGLIKQRAGEKAARRFASTLTESSEQTGAAS